MLLLAIFLIIPPPAPLTPVGMKVIGIFLFIITMWIFVGIGYPSLICIALFPALGVMTTKAAFAASLGNWIVIFIIACLGLAESLRTTGLSRRFALWFMSRPFTAGHPWLLLAMLMLVAVILGGIMSSTAAIVVVMSVAEPMLEVSGFKKGDRFSAVVMMGLAWACTAAFMMTPIGHGSNVLLIEWVARDVGYNLTFTKWMTVGIPVGFLIYLVILGILRYIVRPDISHFGTAAMEFTLEERRKLGSVKLDEKVALSVFILVFFCWVFPGVFGNILPGVASYLGTVGYAIPALVGCGLLCTIRIRKQPLLNFREWMSKMEWSAIILIASIMVIGDSLGQPSTGIPQLLTSAFEPIVRGAPFYVFLFLAILWPSLQTNIMSNLVTAMLVYTVMIPATISTGVGNPVALGFCIFAATRSAFALPSATVVTA
ncbi:SLC13 family permease, partial [Chloroflexota bacterium]